MIGVSPCQQMCTMSECMLNYLSLGHQQFYSYIHIIACTISPVPSPMPGMPFASLQAQHSLLVLCSSTSKKRHDSPNLLLKPLVRLLTLPLLLWANLRCRRPLLWQAVACDNAAHIGHCPLPADVGAPAQSLVPSGIEVQADRAVMLQVVSDVLLECLT